MERTWEGSLRWWQVAYFAKSLGDPAVSLVKTQQVFTEVFFHVCRFYLSKTIKNYEFELKDIYTEVLNRN